MTAAYLEASSRTLPNEIILVVALTLCQFGTGICDGIPLLSPTCREGSLCCIKVG